MVLLPLAQPELQFHLKPPGLSLESCSEQKSKPTAAPHTKHKRWLRPQTAAVQLLSARSPTAAFTPTWQESPW